MNFAAVSVPVLIHSVREQHEWSISISVAAFPWHRNSRLRLLTQEPRSDWLEHKSNEAGGGEWTSTAITAQSICVCLEPPMSHEHGTHTLSHIHGHKGPLCNSRAEIRITHFTALAGGNVHKWEQKRRYKLFRLHYLGGSVVWLHYSRLRCSHCRSIGRHFPLASICLLKDNDHRRSNSAYPMSDSKIHVRVNVPHIQQNDRLIPSITQTQYRDTPRTVEKASPYCQPTHWQLRAMPTAHILLLEL